MPGAPGRRFLTTVLFVDVVGSTTIAAELGDARWRNLLARFRKIVRAELRRYGGRERDTAGDGLFATFAQPAQAIKAAAAIVAAVHALGIDVRSGLHTGECEEIEGGLAGIAVHIGSRVIGLAGPAEILTTQTVRDLVVGSGVEFEERGSHALKGVEGSWPVLAVRAVDGVPLPAPLAPDAAAAELRVTGGSAARRAVRRGWIIAAALLALAAGTVVALVLVNPWGASKAAVGKSAPISLVSFDARTARVRSAVRQGVQATDDLWAVNGTLWQRTGADGTTLVQRNMTTGAIEKTLPLDRTLATPNALVAVAFGFGSIWILEDGVVLTGPRAGTAEGLVARVDQVSGRRLALVAFPGDVSSGTIAVGNGSVLALESDGVLVRIDPLTNRVIARNPTGAVETSVLIPLDSYDWICECTINKVLRFDPSTNRGTTFSIAEQAVLVGVQESNGERTLWLLDSTAGTLTSMDPRTGVTGQPLGLGGNPSQAVIADGAVWAAAGRVVDRVDLQTKARTAIPLPAGFSASSIAVDPQSGSLWLGGS